MIKFWMRLVATNNNKLSNKIFQVLFNMHVANIYSSPWICAIENILNSCGFSYIWLQQCKQSDTWVDYILQQNIKDQFIRRWTSDINNSPKCLNYKLYKQTFGFEKYFDILPYPKYFIFVKFRTCNHKLPIEIGRYTNIPRQERLCTLCDQRCIGDEFHYVLECSKLKSFRAKYLPSVYTIRPNVLKFANLLGSDNHRTLINLTIFLKVSNVL